MSQTAIELKPCPFCGGEDLNLRSNRHMSWVSCTACGLEAPTETGVTDELAVQYWNSRALSALTQGSLTLAQLQAAHIERQEEWCPDQKPDLSFRGNEMAGEVGEACNIIKKLERERHGWRGSRATKDDLANELADVVHTAILCAITAGVDLSVATVRKFNATSEKNNLATRLSALSTKLQEPVRCQMCKGRGEIGGYQRYGDGDVDLVIEPCPECSNESVKRVAIQQWKDISDALTLAHQPVTAGWESMENAPKDGTHILLYAPSQIFQGNVIQPRLTYGHWYIPEHGKYLGDCGGECRCPEYADAPDPYWFSEDGGFTEENPPTHWQPLPAPPVAALKSEGRSDA